jgi:ethanolamine utilization protein EutA
MLETLLSVGIDIGTSTTQLIFSRLTLENQAGTYMVPKIKIANKEVIYRSEIYFTPLKSQIEIDVNGIKGIILKEYRMAGFSPEDMDTGAVIITGETARKVNANLVLNALSELAGDFVVATAGPDLEGVLAAKGAGADKISSDERNVIVNLDIGGGTTNIAKFSKGNLKGTSCLNIGGRLIKIEEGRISYIFSGIEELAKANGISIEVGDKVDSKKLYTVCQLMANQLAMALSLCSPDHSNKGLYTNQGRPLMKEPILDGITYSGGVADCMLVENRVSNLGDFSNQSSLSDTIVDRNFITESTSLEKYKDDYKYGDIGILLARAILNNKDLQRIKTYGTVETIRATVVGAGTHTTNVSGSTISYNQEKLPLKNIPVMRISEKEEGSQKDFIQAINRGLSLYESEDDLEPIAISFSGELHTSFYRIQELARWICEGARPIIDSPYPLVLVIEQDIAKALGNALKVLLKNQKEMICIDGISAYDGDYIDIGEPIAGGVVVPVVTKTLIFNT